MKSGTILQARIDNSKWLNLHIGQLTSKYPNQYVAIFGDKVIAHGKTIPQVQSQLNGEPKGAVTIVYLSNEPQALVI